MIKYTIVSDLNNKHMIMLMISEVMGFCISH